MNITTSEYGFRTRVPLAFEDAVEKITAALQQKGFGVLTEIDVKSTLAEKLGIEFRRYVILGACNPPLAHRALSATLDAGLLLPCNVVVYETGEDESVVSIIDPAALLGVIDDEGELWSLATEARDALRQALESFVR